MSIPQEYSFKCPKCGNEIKTTIWQSINTEMPFAIQDIISGKLFAAECKECGETTRLNYPILFNDMIHGVMISYILPEQENEVVETSKLFSRFGGKFRIVRSQQELMEKTNIFDEGLDDRIVELMKSLIFLQVQSQLEGKTVKALYFHKANDDMCLEFVFTNGENGFVDVDMEMYKQLEEDFIDEINEKADKAYSVDGSWANDFLSKMIEEDR